MYTLNCGGQLLSLQKPVLMGILNLTPDSFYEGSRMADKDLLLQRAAAMISAGATILDIGAQSTRPGADYLNSDAEWLRLNEWLSLLCKTFPDTIVSIDTFHAAVAEKAIDAGVRMVNDISGGRLDAAMIPTVARAGLPFVCMHSRGTPQTMQSLTQYDDLLRELSDYFIERIHTCQEAGIKDIIIDPGFGFAKTVSQNFELLRNLEDFHFLGCPILLGLSRKSTISKTLGLSNAEALNGTTVLNTVGLQKGAKILRVHDLREAKEAVDLLEAMNATSSFPHKRSG